MSNNEEEVDLFDLSASMSESGGVKPVGSETNVLSVEFEPVLGAESTGLTPGVSLTLPLAASDAADAAGRPLDFDAEDFSPAAAPAPAPMPFVSSSVDDLDDDEFDGGNAGVGKKITRMFGALFGKKAAGDLDDLPGLPDDDGLPDLPGDDDFSDLDSLPDPADDDPPDLPGDDDFSDLDSLPDPADDDDLPDLPSDDDFSDLDNLPDPLDDDLPKFGNKGVTIDDDAFDLSAAAPEPKSEFEAEFEAAYAPEIVAVSESSVFEMTPAEQAPEPEPEFEAAPAPAFDEAVVSESSVFEMTPAAQASEPEPEFEAAPAPAFDKAVVSESSVFEMTPAEQAPEPEPEFEAAPAPAFDEAVISESSVFEMTPVAQASEPEPEFEAAPAPAFDEAVVSESSVFEMTPAEQVPVPEPEPDFERYEHRFETVTVPVVSGDSSPEFDAASEPSFEAPAAAAEDGGEEFDLAAAAPAAAVIQLPPPVFNKIAHVCLYVKDLAKSAEFYTKLGFQKRFAFNKDGELFGLYLEFGNGNFVELFEDKTFDSEFARGRLAHFCLETPDIDETIRSLDSRGIDYSPKKLGCDATYQIWLKDPDGNEFEVHQYTLDSSQIHGRDVEADW